MSGKARSKAVQALTPAPVPVDPAAMIQYFEGFGLPGKEGMVYTDTTGNRTVGYGYKLNDDPDVDRLIPRAVRRGERAMTREEADLVFPLVYQRAQRIAHEYATPEVMASLEPQQQAILIDMAYNLGEGGLGGFKKMREALLRGDREGVRREMKDSDWYKQTKRRAKHHVENW